MANIISINLDPLKDGITGTVDKAESTAGRYVIVGTNFDHRVISEKVFQAYIDEMNKREILGCIIIENYMLFYDSTKLVNVDGENYLVGSFLLVKLAETGDSAYLWLSEDDIEEAKEDISGHFAELIINGERYEALCVG